MKHLYCARCGQELVFKRLAVKQLGKIIDCVEPHNCVDKVELPDGSPVELTPITKDRKKEVDKLFDSFEFVQKLNKLPQPANKAEVGDRRSKDDVKDLSSSAPSNLLNMIKKGKDDG